MFHWYGFFDERKNYNFKSKDSQERIYFDSLFLGFRLTEKPCSNSSCYTYPTLPIREFHDLNAPIPSAIDDREYAIPDVNFYSTFSPRHDLYSPRLMRTSTNAYPTLKPIPHCCIHQQPYSTICQPSSIMISPIQEASPIEATCGNSLMMSMSIIEENQSMLIKEINSDDFVFITKINEGLFGSIHLAEMKMMSDDNKIEKQHVIVKLLNENVDEKQK